MTAGSRAPNLCTALSSRRIRARSSSRYPRNLVRRLANLDGRLAAIALAGIRSYQQSFRV
jgi:hypothetical protein